MATSSQHPASSQDPEPDRRSSAGHEGQVGHDLRRVRVIVRGRVQGVWFRDSARQEAQRVGAAGWVRNLPDGSVEAEYEGSPEAVEAMIAWSGQGPARARVDAVSVTDRPVEDERGFRIR